MLGGIWGGGEGERGRGEEREGEREREGGRKGNTMIDGATFPYREPCTVGHIRLCAYYVHNSTSNLFSRCPKPDKIVGREGKRCSPHKQHLHADVEGGKSARGYIRHHLGSAIYHHGTVTPNAV